MRFSCDAMLGTLARWLRLAGFDTIFDPGLTDAELAASSRKEGRWLLTRDRALASAAGPRVVLLRATALAAQLDEVRERLPLDRHQGRWLSRCPRCNGELREASPEEVATRVPPYVAAQIREFRVCAVCTHVYWAGTHVPRIASRLAAIFGQGSSVSGR